MHKTYRPIVFILLMMICLQACKDKANQTSGIFDRSWSSELEEYEKLLKKEPSFNNFQTGILKISHMLVDTTFSNNRKEILLKGIEWCQEYNNEQYGLVFKKEFVKAYPTDDQSKDFLLLIAQGLDEDRQELEVKILYDGILKRWPETPEAKQNWERIKRDPSEFDFFLNETGKQMFGKPDFFAPDSARISQYISFVETYAYAYPDNKKTVELLMSAAQTAKTGGQSIKAIELFDWIWRYYPNAPESPLGLFLKGFTYETDVQNKEFAIEAYTSFIRLYPNHERVKEASFLLENIHTSEEDLIKKMENQ